MSYSPTFLVQQIISEVVCDDIYYVLSSQEISSYPVKAEK